jgi:hypothetical protein
MTTRLQSILAAIALGMAVSPPAAAFFASPGDFVVPSSFNLYQEVGDAGPRSSPQSLAPPGVQYNGIKGTIGEGLDTRDAYKFFFGGGDLWMRTSVDVPGPPIIISVASVSPLSSIPVVASLFTESQVFIAPFEASLEDGLAAWHLGAGNYIVEYVFELFDPPISSAVFTIDPRGNPTAPAAVITAPQAVPEPAPLALALVALLGLSFVRRTLVT